MSQRRKQEAPKAVRTWGKRGSRGGKWQKGIALHLKLEGLGQSLQPLGRRSLLAAFALAAFLWLCLGDTASAAAPANDNFANAAALSGLPANATGTNVDATNESGEPEHAGIGLHPRRTLGLVELDRALRRRRHGRHLRQ